MTFESMEDVMDTFQRYGEQVTSLFEQKKRQSKNQDVCAALELAIEQQRRFRKGALEGAITLSPKQRSAQFKWHDRAQLFQTLQGLEAQHVDGVGDVIDLVEQCDAALRGYCSALTASTNSFEVLTLIEKLCEARHRELRKYVFQISRGMQ